jgi:drug/metabolite transporter (DMT)-like permease
MSEIILAIYAATSSLALIFLKLGSKTGAPVSYIDHRLVFNLGFYVISGVFLYGVSFIIYTYLISKYDLGYIIPVATALVYILIFIASFIIFKESFTVAKIAGISMILIGAILLNINK